ncbi:type II toxin-antitoxin system Phd/YefM family antitoxin [Ramlibacter sp. WS9]|uniref:type II toxin-antitoxin system Phd/YefM family antitoxin n=1 Tax=Ramlibacter sp. WS9 TaxID=1882741 RepID=UPI0011438F22|nr:type II toxin-antitoxin system Phd/YefM family antitoxin [Ramlibacter sp. WS9]ROZ76472.1 type II toxin-antitoxin system Phd/YefM family antitoxin [Ramlibacter sp. WS9]
MATRTIGLEQARKQLPQLAESAHSGMGSLLTKHGKPYAAIVGPELLLKSRRKQSFLALRGTGKGLWGKSPAQKIADLREEWTK